MIWKLFPSFLVLCAGCQICRPYPVAPSRPSAALLCQVKAFPLNPPNPQIQLCGAASTPTPPPVDLPSLWNLALANNPTLREANANVEAAQGRLIQAHLYPNPRFFYDQNTIGSRAAPQGNFVLQLNQEIVTNGKRTLDIKVANQEVDVNSLAVIGSRFALLTRLRLAYYDYIGLEASIRVNEEVIASIQKAIDITRKQVEEAKTRPRTDLLRLETLLENARITLATNQSNRDAAWRQVATEIGLPTLPLPTTTPPELPETPPSLTVHVATERVLAVNSDLKQAVVDTERLRLTLERAKAQAVPNVTIGAGYTAENIDNTAGGAISVDVPLPVWDRNQGHIHEAQALFGKSLAFQQSTANRLIQGTATAFARYKSLRQQVERLTKEVLPRQQQSLDLLLKAYQAGSAQVTFADLFQAQHDLNTSRMTLAEARRSLWQAIADLQGLMQIGVGEKLAACPIVDAALGTPAALSSPGHGDDSSP